MNGTDSKDSALAALETTRSGIILQARQIFLRHAIEHGEVCADHVHDAIELPAGIDPKVLGPVPSPFAKAGIIERTGYRNSTRATAHARPVSVWKLSDRSAAERWLADNSEPETIRPDEPAPVDNRGQQMFFDVSQESATSEGW